MGFGLGRLVFHHDIGTSALQATMIAYPNTGFIGVPVLGALFGEFGVVAVALATVLGMLLFIPVTVILLELTHPRRSSHAPPHGRLLWRTVALPAFVNAARQPLVWAPLLAAALSLAGVGLPPLFLNMLNLLGGITTGLAMFAAGLTLAAFPLRLNFEIGASAAGKMLFQPALMLGLAAIFGLMGVAEDTAVVICALPTGILPTILAARYETYRAEASSTLVLTSLVLLVILPPLRVWLG
jgi:predicted permease